MKGQIALGTLSILLLIGILGYVGLNEPARMQSFTRAYNSRQIEVGAALFENNCRTCHGPQGRGIEGVAPALSTAELFNGAHLQQIGWTGTLEDYLAGVIAAGRPIPSEGTSYPQRMPTWGQQFGGPLREDEVNALVLFIMNWESRVLAEGQATSTPAAEGETVGTDITLSLPEGDAERGQGLSEGALGCSGCHVLAAVGPLWSGEGEGESIAERARERLESEPYTGEATTVEEYLIESVVQPDVYVVEGYAPGVMPGNYGGRLTAQELADLIAYMLGFQ